MPSIQTNNFLSDSLIVQLDNKQLKIDIYDTSLGKRWLDALKDNLDQQRILEKNFCWLGWADSKRDLSYLVTELNANIDQINSFKFDPLYPNIDLFSNDDFQYSADLPIGKNKLGKHLKHEACNKLHRYFEELQGSAWGLSIYYKQADYKTKYAIRQLNNICHEIESWVNADRKKACEPDWMRPSQIVTFLNAPRYKLKDDDYKLFQQNRYNREIGGVYLHWAQVGKTLFEVFRDEDAPKMTDALCSEVNHQVYYLNYHLSKLFYLFLFFHALPLFYDLRLVFDIFGLASFDLEYFVYLFVDHQLYSIFLFLYFYLYYLVTS